MKKLIKKAAATALLVAGGLAVVPTAFCVPDGQNNGRGRLDVHSAMVVGKYFNSVEDFQNLAMANKKYRDLAERYHFNPVEIDPEKQLTIFPNINTYRTEKYGSPNFVYKLPTGINRLLYLPGSFDVEDFWKVLLENKIADKYREYNPEWSRKYELNDSNFMSGCRATFRSGDKEIIFMFDPCIDGTLNSATQYIVFLKYCKLAETILSLAEDFAIPKYTTRLGEGAFEGFLFLDRIDIPNYVTNIGPCAFGYCRNLREIVIPNSVISIEEHAFDNCLELAEINIPGSVTNIGEYAFKDCYRLKKINIPSSVTSLGNGVFKNCSRLEEINIPNTISSINPCTFSDCSSLTNITIPESVTKIKSYAFEACTNLKRIDIPNSVKSIGPYAFAWCENLESITIPNSVTSIDEGAFAWCENLESISIPTSVESISEDVFEDCVHLNRIEFGGNIYRSVSSFIEAFNAYKEAHK